METFLNNALALCGLLAFCITLPGTLELLLLTIGATHPKRRPPAGGKRDLRLAIVIPAHDEASLIGRCVGSVIASARPAGSCEAAGSCETIVVADNCTDQTAAIARQAGARVIVRENADLRGKGYALRMAFDVLLEEGFEAFLIVDADSILSANLVTEVKHRLAAGAAAVQCRYRISNHDASMRTRLMDLAFLAFNVMRLKGRSGWGLSAGILGNGFGLRRETLTRVPWEASSIVEDLEYHLRLVDARERVDFINEATVYGETPATGGSARVQRSRWEGGRLRMAREWAPKLAAEIARGKWRLTEPLLELLLLPLAYHVLLLLFALVMMPYPFREWALAALLLVVLHVTWAASLGGQLWKNAAALLAAPFYIFWKMSTVISVLSASRRNAGWARTARDSQEP
ncbi:MAG TPA: glycosyltransferase family 2 protein [Bryobacteraceae bacterium]|jgi:cellulose synthase/poly-beta-1,6-N-acetylglucosamine synthase-like glycosyltransferase|nr:glycosyltransferase family 2 protein [Bryobacteraceae bacterium]